MMPFDWLIASVFIKKKKKIIAYFLIPWGNSVMLGILWSNTTVNRKYHFIKKRIIF